MTRVILQPYDQLSLAKGAIATAAPGRDEVLMIESEQMLRSRTWHAQRLFLVLSAAEHHAADLEQRGFTVHRMREASVESGLRRFQSQRPDATVVATRPRSRPLERVLASRGIELVDDDSFLYSRRDAQAWRGRIPVMESFYRQQRRRLGILMDGGEPLGGAWNLDAENRLPPPRGEHHWQQTLTHVPDEIDRRTWDDIVRRALPVVGAPPDGTWATTRAGALRQLRHFVEEGLPGFGPYEDAMPAGTWLVNHSLLSPYLNLGLLDPDEVVEAALARFAQGGVPLNSIEGFVRQVIGWREFVNAVYWHDQAPVRDRPALEADQPLPPAFDAPDTTRMNCLGSVLADVHRRGWVHHIPRLMVLANLALIAGVVPGALLDWMRRMFVDAADWVMEPNVLGMGTYADGGAMTTKPYAAGGAYVNRMSDYCRGCPFDPRKRVGADACPYTTLYWDFLARNAPALASNHRMSRPLAGMRALADLDEVRARAAEVRARLAAGDL